MRFRSRFRFWCADGPGDELPTVSGRRVPQRVAGGEADVGLRHFGRRARDSKPSGAGRGRGEAIGGATPVALVGNPDPELDPGVVGVI